MMAGRVEQGVQKLKGGSVSTVEVEEELKENGI